jgi:hypothetical protein
MKSWAIYILAAIGFVIYGAATDVDRDSSGAIVSGGNVDAFNVQVGDCFNDVSSYDEQIASVPGVPCSDPHDNETFAVFDVSFNSYPTDGNMDELAYGACKARFESFVGRDYETSSLEISTMYPSVQSWNENDREVVCAVYDVNDNQLVGSAAGRGL